MHYNLSMEPINYCLLPPGCLHFLPGYETLRSVRRRRAITARPLPSAVPADHH